MISIETRHPLTDKFPDLSDVWVIKTERNAYLKGSGLLRDGHIVLLFLSEGEAKATIHEVSDSERDVSAWQLEKLGCPVRAMKEAASEGAAGFQLFLSGDEKSDAKVLRLTNGRVLFPFLVRIEELANRVPTVLGSALLCDDGVYLTALGERHFGAQSLSQWVNWKLMDKASAEHSVHQPFRYVDPGDPFFCLSVEKNHIGIYEEFGPDDEIDVKRFNYPAIVFFAKDSVLKQYCSPEGYLPIFGSEEDGKNFLRNREGGAFHIQWLEPDNSPNNYIKHHILHSQDLEYPEKKGLTARLIEVTNLPQFLFDISNQFKCPPFIKFVINPSAHRDEVAWGLLPTTGWNVLPETRVDKIKFKGISHTWELNSQHQTNKLSSVDYFDATDTFYFNGIGFDFAELMISYAPSTEEIDGILLEQLSDAELGELIDLKLTSNWQAKNLDEEPVADLLIYNELDAEEFISLSFEKKRQVEQYCVALMKNWVVRFWQNVDGEKIYPVYFESFLDLAGFVMDLVKQDEQMRIDGAYGVGYIGFEGSGSKKLETSVTEKFMHQVRSLCLTATSKGYNPGLASSLMILANRVLKGATITICGYGADLIVTHIPNSAISDEDFYSEVGLPSFLAIKVQNDILRTPHPSSYRALIKRVGKKDTDSFAPETISFLTTAMFNFTNNGSNLNFDYAPVSVQVVKALEYEMRRLFRAIFANGHETLLNSGETDDLKKLSKFISGDDSAVSLGSLIRNLRKARNSDNPAYQAIRQKLSAIHAEEIFSKKTVKFIENDVLKKFRNGGAHDSFIKLETCQRCINSLLGSEASSGLIALFAVAAKNLEVSQ